MTTAPHVDVATAPAGPPRGRLFPLDGLRGLAAVVVFAHHALILLYGPLAGVNEHHWPIRPRQGMWALQHLPVAWLFNGTFAVSFFFVLSGFVLTRAMGPAPKPDRIARLVTVRLLRLLPLVLLGTALGFMTFDLAVQQLDALRLLAGNDSSAYIEAELLARHGPMVAVKQVLATIWRGATAASLFDPPLWSIGVELKGSLLVYLLAGTFATTPRAAAKYWVGVPLGLCLMGTASLSFLAGMGAAEYGKTRDDVLLPLPRAALYGLLLLALGWASVHPWDRNLWLPLPCNPPEILDTLMSTACALVLMASGLQLAGLRWFLASRPVQFLGHASYGLYVLHVPLLYVGLAPLLRLFDPVLGRDAAGLASLTLLLALALALGSAIISHVDTPLARWSKRRVEVWLGA